MLGLERPQRRNFSVERYTEKYSGLCGGGESYTYRKQIFDYQNVLTGSFTELSRKEPIYWLAVLC